MICPRPSVSWNTQLEPGGLIEPVIETLQAMALGSGQVPKGKADEKSAGGAECGEAGGLGARCPSATRW